MKAVTRAFQIKPARLEREEDHPSPEWEPACVSHPWAGARLPANFKEHWESCLGVGLWFRLDPIRTLCLKTKVEFLLPCIKAHASHSAPESSLPESPVFLGTPCVSGAPGLGRYPCCRMGANREMEEIPEAAGYSNVQTDPPPEKNTSPKEQCLGSLGLRQMGSFLRDSVRSLKRPAPLQAIWEKLYLCVWLFVVTARPGSCSSWLQGTMQTWMTCSHLTTIRVSSSGHFVQAPAGCGPHKEYYTLPRGAPTH